MTAIAYRASRIAWLWCVAYTAVAPRDRRERRRGEIRSHLWESEHAHLSPLAVGWAALRGSGSDLLWAATCGVPQLIRSFATPTPYIALAPVFPIQGWIVATVATGATASFAESLGAIGGMVTLAIAGLVWLVRRS